MTMHTLIPILDCRIDSFQHDMDEWTWEGYDIYLERAAYTPEEFRKVMAEHDARRPKLTPKPGEREE